jgi:RNA polymerase sigma-70 factor (family 1)
MSIQGKHEKDFEELFKNNYTKLYYYALNIIHDSEEVKDIVSDVFKYLWEHFEEMDESSSVTALLYTLVKNSCIDRLRHQDVSQKYEKVVMEETFSWVEYEYNERDERLDQVMKSIETLPTQTKAVFKKCFISGKKYKDVAEEMGISINTVKTHMTKALKIVRENNRQKK